MTSIQPPSNRPLIFIFLFVNVFQYVSSDEPLPPTLRLVVGEVHKRLKLCS
jgi:hypothetical protein